MKNMLGLTIFLNYYQNPTFPEGKLGLCHKHAYDEIIVECEVNL